MLSRRPLCLPPMRPWFRVALPICWSAVTLGSMANPGDEYGMLLGSAIVGVWPLFFIQVGDIHAAYPLLVSIGTMTMFLFGWLFDWQRVSRRLWAFVWLAIAAGLCWKMLSEYPSLARARSKNGSIEAYVFTSLNLSLTLCCLILPAVTWLSRIHRRVPPPGHCTSCGYDLRGSPGLRCPECGVITAGEQHRMESSGADRA